MGSTHSSRVGMFAAMHLPAWLGIAGSLMFVVIAVSHLWYLARTDGQRRPWHACHVLTAVGMASMYAATGIDPVRVPAVLWQLVFASAGALAALWALGGTGRVPTLMWLATSIDLAAMLYMWSPHSRSAPLSWLLVAYFVAQAGMWALDAYRRLDGRSPVVSWNLMSDPGGRAILAAPVASTRASVALMSGLDIGASMVAMTLGMGLMLAWM